MVYGVGRVHPSMTLFLRALNAWVKKNASSADGCSVLPSTICFYADLVRPLVILFEKEALELDPVSRFDSFWKGALEPDLVSHCEFVGGYLSLVVWQEGLDTDPVSHFDFV